MIKPKQKYSYHEEAQQKDKHSLKERLALLALQKQLQLLRMKEIFFIASFIAAGALGRVLMQPLPSVEPITFFAILTGWMFGKKKGFAAGASALYLSNFFVFGGQGPWTIFQAFAFGAAGFLGGFLRKNATILECFVITLISTLLFEIIMNTSSIIFIPGGIFTAFLLGIPFLIVHAVSNGIFSLFLPKIKGYAEKEGRFNERDIYRKLVDEVKRRKNAKQES